MSADGPDGSNATLLSDARSFAGREHLARAHATPGRPLASTRAAILQVSQALSWSTKENALLRNARHAGKRSHGDVTDGPRDRVRDALL